MVVRVVLVASEPAERAVSSSVEIDLEDPAWSGRLIESVSRQAAEGARWLTTQLADPASEDANTSGVSYQGAVAERPFVPLSDLLPRTL